MNETVLSTFVGGMITWFVTYKYYIKAANELNSEASELKRLNNMLLQAMEAQKWIKINRRPDGSIAGFEQILETQGIDGSRSGSHTVRHR